MKKLLLTSAALFVMTTACSADRIQPFVGVNPTSGAGSFANTDPGTGAGGSGLFVDLYPFTLAGTQVLTIAFATNTFADGDIQKILNFTGAVVNEGADNAPGGVGINADTVVIGPVAATPCVNIPSCQIFGGSAVLPGGDYHLRITGNAGANAGYGGNLSTSVVPGPIAGAGLPGLIAACLALYGLHRRRRRLAA